MLLISKGKGKGKRKAGNNSELFLRLLLRWPLILSSSFSLEVSFLYHFPKMQIQKQAEKIMSKRHLSDYIVFNT